MRGRGLRALRAGNHVAAFRYVSRKSCGGRGFGVWLRPDCIIPKYGKRSLEQNNPETRETVNKSKGSFLVTTFSF